MTVIWLPPLYAIHSNWLWSQLFHLLCQGYNPIFFSLEDHTPPETPLTRLSSQGLTRDLKSDEATGVTCLMLKMLTSLNMSILSSVEWAPRHVCTYQSIISPGDKNFTEE